MYNFCTLLIVIFVSERSSHLVTKVGPTIMKIVLLQTGKDSENYITEGSAIFINRIRKYIPFEVNTLPDIKNVRNMPVEQQKTKEGGKILQFITTDDYLVILDAKGRERTTIELSEWLQSLFMLQNKRIVFVIGGPWGISDDVLRRGDETISLSRLTFSHQVVRLLFLEQLYRVLSFLRGDPYHHE
jgi:23S rRNA (pseudouridine1915-N3)-methyltransferase